MVGCPSRCQPITDHGCQGFYVNPSSISRSWSESQPYCLAPCSKTTKKPLRDQVVISTQHSPTAKDYISGNSVRLVKMGYKLSANLDARHVCYLEASMSRLIIKLNNNEKGKEKYVGLELALSCSNYQGLK